MSAILQIFSKVPTSVWFISLATFLMNISTIMVFSIVPIFMNEVLGASISTIGRIEGFVEALAWIVRVFSGILSDYIRQRKILFLIGYILLTLTRPFFAFASNIWLVLAARVLDRVGNGIQASPRDALVGDLAPADHKGICYGVREGCGRMGSVVGALLGMALLAISFNNYYFVFWIGVIPAILAVFTVSFYVKEPLILTAENARQRFDWRNVKEFEWPYWMVLLVSGMFGLAHCSEGFLILRGREIGISPSFVPVVMVTMNFVMAATVYIVGKLCDILDRRLILAFGFCTLLAADLVITQASSPELMIVGVFLWGIQMGATQVVFVSLVADTSPLRLRATGFGLYYLINGISLFLANVVIASTIADFYGTVGPFISSAVICCAAIFTLPFLYSKQARTP